jgi:hypothetical protein
VTGTVALFEFAFLQTKHARIWGARDQLIMIHDDSHEIIGDFSFARFA